uniref:Uncharacterized protein n=1 Tax=Chromera velia CCMP2878 TaxID=1169474 RepID=A0A0G4FRG8_9ALVE|mmetsp:Transcript_40054/g.78962  ORF Transcript_40054/g.78962 Transcript_40054/m.78962 type:complete len:201 (+) Transcript_40054:204-806(+)|eukprot:Cvel_439.t1-p1 / transcript=Cvel_439.t1 / gene=Cvel_439 / organism=Chromera_velia_CCMP2878 / gene_product=hypothetical protein / transcript_product=hypothetical protein / location=Cvel_scaffold14:83920-84519(-) / protein_length=200 / sequence_SO=supercontig / SO=protein_coding / is_pseudo=false
MSKRPHEGGSEVLNDLADASAESVTKGEKMKRSGGIETKVKEQPAEAEPPQEESSKKKQKKEKLKLVRCRGTTKYGVRCGFSSLSVNGAADPLRNGSYHCHNHTAQKGDKNDVDTELSSSSSDEEDDDSEKKREEDPEVARRREQLIRQKTALEAISENRLVRCHGTNRFGERCGLTNHSVTAGADPLRAGERFCRYHQK